MRWLRVALVLGLVVKLALVGLWWRTSVARAERPAEPAETGVAPDLFARSRGFRELLDAVRQRGEELERREQALAARESALKTLEQMLSEEAGRLESGAGASAPERAGCGVALTKIYQSMRPEEAAPIIDRLDDATAKAIFGCMKEKQIGAILAAMNRERAVALTRALAGS
jgi:flagellar motility protein MotE (MotC chaperone)